MKSNGNPILPMKSHENPIKTPMKSLYIPYIFPSAPWQDLTAISQPGSFELAGPGPSRATKLRTRRVNGVKGGEIGMSWGIPWDFMEFYGDFMGISWDFHGDFMGFFGISSENPL